MAFTEIHDYLFDFLLKESESNPELFFRTRRTNRSNKLSQGYWFLGTDEYLTIGFWEGMDWKRKIPNIGFVVDPNGKSKIVISASDSQEKNDFLKKELSDLISFKKEKEDEYDIGYKIKNYFEIEFVIKDYKSAIIDFLDQYWPKINKAVNRYESFSEKLPLGNIKRSVFKKDVRKIFQYKEENQNFEDELENLSPYKLAEFRIEGYGPIKTCELVGIPRSNQWIFLTGENGVGKSSIVKALAMILGHRTMPAKEKKENWEYRTSIVFHTRNEKSMEISRRGNDHSKRIKPYTTGFAAYGPFRLNPIIGERVKNSKTTRSKTEKFKSLFDNNGLLLDLESELSNWKTQKSMAFEKRKYAITELLQEALLNVQLIEFENSNKGTPITLFYEEDLNGNTLPPVTIDKLSSGYKSIMAMMSDMLIRLFKQQPKIHDPGDLEGVVFIDEIDIHLHPKFQKHLIQQLSAAFPNVQFIVTTHSPIPLLGAPKNSIVCVVTRDKELGVKINRVDDKIYIEELLPNTLLTSPIFGMEDITNDNRERKVRTETTYKEMVFVKKLENKIEDFFSDRLENELIERIKNRRK